MSPNGWSKRIPNPPKIYKNPSLDSYVSPWVPLGTPGSLKWCSKAPKWCPNGVPIAPRFKSSEARVIKSSGGQKEGGRRQGRSLEIRRAVLAQLCRRVGSHLFKHKCQVTCTFTCTSSSHMYNYLYQSGFSKFASDFSHLLRGLQKHAFSQSVVLLSKTSTFRSKCV